VKIRPLLLVVALASSTVLAIDTTASADPGMPFDVHDLAVPDLRISSAGCHRLPVTARYDADGIEGASAQVLVYKRRKLIDERSLDTTTPGTLAGTYLHCRSQGLGTFTAGPMGVDYATTGHAATGSFTDDATATFTIKQDARLRGLTVTRDGKVRTVRVKSTFFDTRRARWRSAKKGHHLMLQRRLVTGGGWREVTTFTTGKGGFGTVRVNARQSWTYRVVDRASSTTWGSTSSTKTS
jgi:hypothetical protein